LCDHKNSKKHFSIELVMESQSINEDGTKYLKFFTCYQNSIDSFLKFPINDMQLVPQSVSGFLNHIMRNKKLNLSYIKEGNSNLIIKNIEEFRNYEDNTIQHHTLGTFQMAFNLTQFPPCLINKISGNVNILFCIFN
jgi:hypothetical protein